MLAEQLQDLPQHVKLCRLWAHSIRLTTSSQLFFDEFEDLHAELDLCKMFSGQGLIHMFG